LFQLDAGFEPKNILILWKGLDGWEDLGYPVISTQITTTTTQLPATTQPPATSQAPIEITKTATLSGSTPSEINKEQIRQAVLDLYVPEFKPVQELIPILMTVTNPTNSQWASDIPITFTNLDDENQVATWMINVTLDVGETNEVLVWGIKMGEGRWKVKVGFKTSIIFTS